MARCLWASQPMDKLSHEMQHLDAHQNIMFDLTCARNLHNPVANCQRDLGRLLIGTELHAQALLEHFAVSPFVFPKRGSRPIRNLRYSIIIYVGVHCNLQRVFLSATCGVLRCCNCRCLRDCSGPSKARTRHVECLANVAFVRLVAIAPGTAEINSLVNVNELHEIFGKTVVGLSARMWAGIENTYTSYPYKLLRLADPRMTPTQARQHVTA